MIDELGVFPHNASDCAPLIVGDIVYVSTSNGQDWTHSNIPSPNAPSLIALDKRTGEFLGEDDAKIGPRIFHGQWSSPSAGSVNGRQLVFFGGGDGVCYAFDPNPVKEDDTQFPEEGLVVSTAIRRSARSSSIPTPKAPAKSTPRRCSGRTASTSPSARTPSTAKAWASSPASTPPRPATSRRPARSGPMTRSTAASPLCPSLPTGLLFVGDFSGYLHCFDAETGKLYWTHDMKAHMWGSTLVADGKVYIGDEDGDLVVFAASKEKKILSETNLGRAGLFDAGRGQRRALRCLQHAPVRLPDRRRTAWLSLNQRRHRHETQDHVS